MVIAGANDDVRSCLEYEFNLMFSDDIPEDPLLAETHYSQV